MKMPLSEILDRYTITKLKSERTDEDVSNELRTYKREIDSSDYVDRSVTYNYLESTPENPIWYTSSLARSTWTVEGVYSKP